MGDTATLHAGRDQHLQALDRANRVRLARAELKRQVNAGKLSAAEVVARCPWEVESMAVNDLLMSQKRWGRTRSRRTLQAIPVRENMPMSDLTQRQRRALVTVLEQASQRAAPTPVSGARVLSAA